MNNILPGILTILLCTISGFVSWKYFSKGNYTIALLLLILLGLILRIYTSTDFFLHEWDERYHALVAKNLINHPFTPTLYDNPVLPYNYQDWSANHIWLHKQPVPLWSMSISLYLFGINEFAVRFPSMILSTIGIWLIYQVASYFFNKKTGFIAAFLFSINGLILELTGGRVATDHIDIFFLFFVLLAVYFSTVFVQKKKAIYNILVGISIGAAILSKWLPALIVIPIWLLLVYQSKSFSIKTIIWQLILILTVTCIVFLPWQIYIYSYFPVEANWEAGFNVKHFTEALEGRSGSVFYFIDRIRINYGELIYIPLIWFIWKTFRKPIDLKRLAILTWFIIPLLFFSLAKTKMQGYLLFTSPALFVMTADFWWMIYEYRNQQKLKWLYNVLLILFIALPVRYTIERIKPFEKRDRNPPWVAELRELNKKEISKGVLFNYNSPIEAMFYTNLVAYEQIPDQKTINDLISKEYQILINNNDKISDEIRKMNGIQFVGLSEKQVK